MLTRLALELSMPLGSERFAETICARLGIGAIQANREGRRATSANRYRCKLNKKGLDSANGGGNDAK